MGLINGWTKAKMIAHIKKQFKGKSVIKKEHYPHCLYRGPEGKKCAVGMFIPDEMYNPNMEKQTVTKLCEDYPNLMKHMPLDVASMQRLQVIHDEDIKDVKYGVDKRTDEQVLDQMIEWIKDNV